MTGFQSRTAALTLGVLAYVLSMAGCSPGAMGTDSLSTDILQAPYTISGDSVVIGSFVNRTQRDGYDNQPHYAPDGSALLYTSERNGQTDIYRWPLAADRPHPLTTTGTSEYSPTPLSDSTFAVVRVEDDGAQRLWQFSTYAEGPDAVGTLLLPEVEPVGYFAMADTADWALFVLGEPPTLQWVSQREDARAVVVQRDIGRSIQSLPHAPGVSIVQRYSGAPDSLVVVRSPDDTHTYAPVLQGDGDHAWTQAGYLLMTSGTALYQWHSSKDAWRKVYDWAPATPSRIAVSPTGGQMAVVVTHRAP